jgi:hypothetical protein
VTERRTTRILLKARPLPAQLADRLAPPKPEGLELYLDAVDLQGDGWLSRLQGAVAAGAVPADFVWIVEAPIRTLGGQYFDLSQDDADHRETLARVIQAGEAIGAQAANVHLVAPTVCPDALHEPARQDRLAAAHRLLEFYVDRCADAGLIPQIENVPPVGRMREAAFVFSPIGADPADLLALLRDFATLRFTVDLSHAGLYLAWRAWSPDRADSVPDLGIHGDRAGETGAIVARFGPTVAAFQRSRPGPADLTAYVAALVEWTATIHVSNARGLLGEGRRYADGAADLDAALAPTLDRVPFWVTETLEADPERATGMRDAQRRLAALRSRVAGRST